MEEQEDIAKLKDMVQQHVDATNSPRGQEVLDNFEALLPKFVKIYPTDYRLALERMAKEAAENTEKELQPA